MDNIRRFHQKGGMVVMGTDTMRMTQQPQAACVPLREAGLSVREVVAACTRNTALACHLDGMGSLRPGKAA